MLVGHKKVASYLVIDVKMHFTCKYRLVLDWHKNSSHEGSMCAGAVSQESVRVSFTCASLNEAYVTNTHLQITI